MNLNIKHKVSLVRQSLQQATRIATTLACVALSTAVFGPPQAAQATLPRPFRHFKATLLQLNEIAGVPFTGAYGAGRATLNPNTGVLNYEISFTGVPTATGSHIHANIIGANAPVRFDLQQGRPFTAGVVLTGTIVLTPGAMLDLYQGRYYMNVHTIANPGGEMRGQLLPVEFTRAYGAALSGANEVPVVVSSGEGSALVIVSDKLDRFAYWVQTNLTATAAHIHTGTVGNTGSVAFDLLAGGSLDPVTVLSGTGTLNPAQLQALASGGYYINIHTTANPSGELRGQLFAREILLAANLSGAAEVPPVSTGGSGMASMHLDHVTGELDYMVNVSGIPSATMAHIHQGAVGVTGAVVVDLFANGNGQLDPGTALIGQATLTPTQVNDLLSGNHYVNVHTLANPSGELRGQIGEPKRYLAFRAVMNGASEVPTPTNTSASGVASLVLDTSNNQLAYKFMTQEMTPTAAHIHTGTITGTGGIAFGLSLSGTGVVTMTDAQVELLLSHGYYVNVHSAAFPAGEIRGQVNPYPAARDYQAVLHGIKEVPANGSFAGGLAQVVLDETQTRIEYCLGIGRLISITAAHIHRGAEGANGPVVYNLNPSSSFEPLSPLTGTIDITPADLNDLLLGMWYFNIHTTPFSGGEVRGNIQSSLQTALFVANLNGASEVPTPTNTSASGYATLLLNTFTGVVSYNFVTQGMTPTAAHIHTGTITGTGGVAFGLSLSGTGTFTPSKEQLVRLVGGGYYVNVHSAAFPSGEIRGQLYLDVVRAYLPIVLK
jgi:hypothetical protein